ncbi:MAG TPA: hypothetical protein VE690_04690 [Rhodopila sp.]|nr:hypothetical protein [Rhodopila sp.]
MPWTRITDPDAVNELLPAWMGRRMVGLHGAFGLLLTTGDIMRLRSIAAAWKSPDGVILLDVLLDDAGIPDGIDLAWRSKHFLGAPVPGAALATINLAQVAAAVEFTVAEMAARPVDRSIPLSDDLQPEQTDDAQPPAAGREVTSDSQG